jgi:hypothetical protein
MKDGTEALDLRMQLKVYPGFESTSNLQMMENTLIIRFLAHWKHPQPNEKTGDWG